jgi:hypothetical protein
MGESGSQEYETKPIQGILRERIGDRVIDVMYDEEFPSDPKIDVCIFGLTPTGEIDITNQLAGFKEDGKIEDMAEVLDSVKRKLEMGYDPSLVHMDGDELEEYFNKFPEDRPKKT